jgi:hypothetical protein
VVSFIFSKHHRRWPFIILRLESRSQSSTASIYNVGQPFSYCTGLLGHLLIQPAFTTLACHHLLFNLSWAAIQSDSANTHRWPVIIVLHVSCSQPSPASNIGLSSFRCSTSSWAATLHSQQPLFSSHRAATRVLQPAFYSQHLQRWPVVILLLKFIVSSSPTQFTNIEPHVLTRLPFQSRHSAHQYWTTYLRLVSTPSRSILLSMTPVL